MDRWRAERDRAKQRVKERHTEVNQANRDLRALEAYEARFGAAGEGASIAAGEMDLAQGVDEAAFNSAKARRVAELRRQIQQTQQTIDGMNAKQRGSARGRQLRERLVDLQNELRRGEGTKFEAPVEDREFALTTDELDLAEAQAALTETLADDRAVQERRREFPRPGARAHRPHGPRAHGGNSARSRAAPTGSRS